jgi:hypothetical protein
MNSPVMWFPIVAMIASAPAAAANTPVLFSYDATYSVQLAQGSSSAGPRAASGILDYRFAETCEGWQTRTRVVMDLTFRDGTMLVNKRDFESFESKDGRDYTFAVRTNKGDVPVEAFRGTAKMPARGNGTVIYEIPNLDVNSPPRKVTITLPRDTLLPVQHSLALLERATKGDRQFRSVIFNGASSVGPRTMSTIIGPQLAPNAPPNLLTMPDVDAALLNAPAWDINLAFYNLIEPREMPNFEVFQRFYASGIAPSFEQQFSDFTIRAELDRLQRLPVPECPAKPKSEKAR